MEFKITSGHLDAEEWNSKISRYPNKTAYHTYEWLDFIEKSQSLNKVIYEILLDGKVQGYLPGFVIKKGPVKIFASPFPGWTTPYMGPLMSDSISQEAFFRGFKRLMKQERYHYAEFSNRALDPELAKNHGYIIQEGVTYITPVAKTPDDILAGYKKSTRYYARKSIRDGILEVETTLDYERFLDHYYIQLQKVFMKSNMKPTYTKKRVKTLIESLLPTDRLMLSWVKYKEEIAACKIDIIDDTWMYSFGSPSHPDYLRYRPNELLRFHVMCEAAKRGVQHYDMVGGGTYKSNYGGKKVPVYKFIYSKYGLYGIRNISRDIIRLKNKLSTKMMR